MGTGDFRDEFKRDPVAQITERGYASLSNKVGFVDGPTCRFGTPECPRMRSAARQCTLLRANAFFLLLC